MWMSCVSLVLAAWLMWCGEGMVCSSDSGTHHIPRVTDGIEVDGMLNDVLWEKAWRMPLEYEVRPGENIDPPVTTHVLVAYDDDYVYFGFEAKDPDPRAIRAHLCDRDAINGDDWVCMILDTFNDERRSFGFLVNPMGVQNDFIETIDGGGGSEWDTIWDSAARIHDWGWAAEMRIPFSSLRFQRNPEGQVWGIDAIRSYPRRVRHHIGLFPRDRSNNCYLCQAVKVKGFEGVSPGRNLEIVPTVTAGGTQERIDFPDGEFETADDYADLGMTARWGVTPNLTLSGAVNPDFSQVEADVREVDINSPFALFYPEKRPFFMEGADFFESHMDAVYTRMVYDPAYGAKLSGKEGSHTMGAFVVRDDQTHLLLPGVQSSDLAELEGESTAAVARYKVDFGSRLTLGALGTYRGGENYDNRVVGADGDIRISERDRVRFQGLWSETEYPETLAEEYDIPAGRFDDRATKIVYSHNTRTLDWWGEYRYIGEGFRADLGFMPQVGYERTEAGAGYEWNPRSHQRWFSRLYLQGLVRRDDDMDGNLLADRNQVQFTYEGPLQSHGLIEINQVQETYEGREFDTDYVFLHWCMRPNGDSHCYLNYIFGNDVDYANTRAAEKDHVDAGLFYQVGRHLRLDVQHTYQRLEVDAGRLYTVNLSQMTTSYQFSARSMVRGVFQYMDVNRDAALYIDEVDPEEQHLFTQLLYSFKLNPQTVLFVGYSDNAYGTWDTALRQADRTVFLKLGKAWCW